MAQVSHWYVYAFVVYFLELRVTYPDAPGRLEQVRAIVAEALQSFAGRAVVAPEARKGPGECRGPFAYPLDERRVRRSSASGPRGSS